MNEEDKKRVCVFVSGGHSFFPCATPPSSSYVARKEGNGPKTQVGRTSTKKERRKGKGRGGGPCDVKMVLSGVLTCLFFGSSGWDLFSHRVGVKLGSVRVRFWGGRCFFWFGGPGELEGKDM